MTTKTEYKAVYILPELYFPKFPKPGTTIPLDVNRNEVTDNDTPIQYVIIDYSYYQSLVKYKAAIKETEVKYTTFKEKLTNSR